MNYLHAISTLTNTIAIINIIPYNATTFAHIQFIQYNRFASSVGAVHFYTSAKLNKGIDEMFLDLTKRM